MERALAVSGQDDRAVAGFLQELVERDHHIAICEVERLSGFRLVGQEGAERRLAIARRPDRPDLVEGACLGTQEQLGDGICLGVVDRTVPMRRVDVGCRVDEEDRCLWRCRGLVALGGPERRVAGAVGPRDPHLRIGIGGRLDRGLYLERCRGDLRPADQLRTEQGKSEAAGDHQHDENGEGVEEFPGQGLWSPRGAAVRGADAAGMRRLQSGFGPALIAGRRGDREWPIGRWRRVMGWRVAGACGLAILAAIGAVAAILLQQLLDRRPYADGANLPLESWRSLLSVAIGTGAIAFGFGVERVRLLWAVGFALLTGAAAGLIYYWNGGNDGWSDFGNWRYASLFLSIAIARTPVPGARDEGRGASPIQMFMAMPGPMWCCGSPAGSSSVSSSRSLGCCRRCST